MFSEIPVMVLYSNQLVADLEVNVIKNWNDHTKVGTVFLKMVREVIIGATSEVSILSPLSLSFAVSSSSTLVPLPFRDHPSDTPLPFLMFFIVTS